MASPSLALPGVLFVGEDDRARLVAHLGPAAGWMIPKGILGWSTEVSVVAREALTESVRRDAKIVMPEEQIAAAKMPLTHQAALKSPLVSISGRLTQKLVDAGIRVHTIGADRVTSSFYYIAEGGGEAPVRVEGDLVAAVGAMLGERADNAAIERVLDGLVDRLLRSLSKDRVTELTLELAAALPRAASDGSGTNDLDLASFEKEVAGLVGASEKYTSFLREIATKLETSNERKVEIPLFVDARKVSQGPFELTVGDQSVPLATHERWLATGPLTEPVKAAPVAAEKARAPAPAPVQRAPEPEPKAPTPKPVQASPAPAPVSAPANIRPLAAPLNPPRPGSNPPGVLKDATPSPAAAAPVKAAPEPKAEPVAAKVEEEVAPAPAVETAAKEPAPKKEPEPKKETVVVKAEEPAPKKEPAKAKKETAVEPAPAEAKPRDSRLATTQKIQRKKEGFPWPWVLLIVIAAAFAAYRLGFIPH
ncbi:MAG TPA: hypothetical protein VM925_33475 [Labilithrix sp.]|nr:hypothetical protein [Labilithrix sp.]